MKRGWKRGSRGWVADGVGFIPLTKGLVAKVDVDLLPELEKFTWYAHKTKRSAYAGTNVFHDHGVRQKTIQMHRYVLFLRTGREVSQSIFVDHINHDGLDNRTANLREASPAENNRNTRKHLSSSTGYKGVSFHKQSGKYSATIRRDGKLVTLGRCKTPEEAFALYCEAAKKVGGEFACVE